MKKTYFALMIAGAAVALAQMPPPGHGGMRIMGFDGFHPGKVVANAPFSGKQVTTETQTLADGNQITHTITSQFYRDAEGRTRIERTFSGVGPWAGGTPRTMIEIHDPVGGYSYMLDASKQTATKMTMPPPRTRTGETKTFSGKARSGENVTTENLGSQTINGLNATGTRSTETIPAGANGNTRAITIVSERWYSPDLQMVIQSKRTDPRSGEADTHFENVVRASPDASLFQPPASYAITTRPSHGGPDTMAAPPPPPAEQ